MAPDDRKRLVARVLQRFQRGESKRAIARALRVDPKTVRKIIKKMEKRRADGDDALARELPTPRAPRASKLDRFSDFIDRELKAYPDLTAQRLLEKLKVEGFDGKYTIVRMHLRNVRPKPAKRAFDPVYTEPGKQGQADWSPYHLPGCRLFVVAFSLVLHYSSYQYIDFATNRKHASLFRQLVAAFEDFEGVPAEIVFDSEKTVVDYWDNGEPVINLRFADFAAYYDFQVHIAPRADGPYKGGVERPFRTTEENFFNGRTFKGIDDARGRLREWRDAFAERKHATKRRRRTEMFEEDKARLKPLPTHPYDTSEIVWRIVDGYHRVLFDTNTYTVPRAYVGCRLCVRASETTVRIYDGAIRLLATHARAPHGAHKPQTLPEHGPVKRIDIDKVIRRFEGLSDMAGVFAKRLRSAQRRGGVQLVRILQLQADYQVQDLIAAIEQAHSYSAFSAKAVRRILEVSASRLSFKDIITRQLRDDIAETMARVPVRQRALETYQQLLAGREDNHEDQGHDDDKGDQSS